MTKLINSDFVELGLLKFSLIKAISNSEDIAALKAIAEQFGLALEIPEEPTDNSANEEPAQEPGTDVNGLQVSGLDPAFKGGIKSGLSLEDLKQENPNSGLSFTNEESFGDNDNEIPMEEELALLTK